MSKGKLLNQIIDLLEKKQKVKLFYSGNDITNETQIELRGYIEEYEKSVFAKVGANLFLSLHEQLTSETIEDQALKQPSGNMVINRKGKVKNDSKDS